MQFIFRADADKEIGTGHLIRSLSLAEAFIRRGHEILFTSRCENKILQTKIIKLGCKFIPMDPFNTGYESDPFLRLLKDSYTAGGGKTDDWVVIDGYHFDRAYQMAIRKAGFRLLVIDDYCHLPEYSCDVLLNQNIYALDIQYPIDNDQALLLLGSKYALIRPEFIAARESREKAVRDSHNILITLGGADPENVTLKVVEAIKTANVPHRGIRIVLGPENPHLNTITEAVQAFLPDAELFHSVEDMYRLMGWADIAITAGGITCLELCCIGVPFIVVIMSRNQEYVAKGLEKSGAAINIGWHHRMDRRAIARAVDMLISDKSKRQLLSKAGRKIVDGRGVDRVVEKIRPSSLTVRPVGTVDSERLWRWANDPVVRNAAFRSEPIHLADHQKWFAEKMADANCHHFIVIDDDGNEVGQIRFDVDGSRAEVDVSLDNSRRFIGLGPKVLKAGIKAVKTRYPITQIYARVKSENIPSIKAFQKAGFQDDGNTVAFGHKCRLLTYTE